MKYTAKRSHLLWLGLLLTVSVLTIQARLGAPLSWSRKPLVPVPVAPPVRAVKHAGPLLAAAPVQSGGSFNITQAVIAGGGERSSGGTNEITGTLGQGLTTQSSGGTYAIQGGFWPGAVPSQCPTISLTPATLPNGDPGVAYPNQVFTASGGSAPYTFSRTGTLPPGLTFTAATATLAGTPTTPGTFNFTIIATDANQCTGSQNYALTINCPALTLNPAAVPAGTVGVPYQATQLSVTGGTAPFTFQVVGGSVPQGMSLSSSGLLSGTPTAPLGVNLTIRATDANGCTGQRTYDLQVTCPAITLNPATIPNGTVGVAYPNTQLTAMGGTLPHTFQVTGGSVPPGMTFTPGGLLSGTPTQPLGVNLTIRASDANGCFVQRTYDLQITCQTITINPATIPDGTTGAAYTQMFTQSGALGAVTFQLTGALPAGLSFTAGTATLAGTPTQSGSFPITVTATEANNCAGARNYTLVVNNAGCPTITVNPATIPAGATGAAYSQTFTQTGGVGTVTFNLTGTLPTGLSFAGATLSGTPTQAGSFPITVTATDAGNCTGSRAYTLVIGSCPTITVNPATLPNGFLAQGYNQTLTATGGTAPHTFAVTSGALPNGVALAAGGALTGTPVVAGTFNFTVTSTDAAGCTGTRAYALDIINCSAVTVNPAGLPNGFVGTAYSQTLTATGETPPHTFSVSSGSLPTGLTLASGSALTGTPTTQATFTFTVRATAANGCTGTRAYTVIISGNGLQFFPLPQPVRLLETRVGFTGCTTPGVPINANGTLTLPARTTCAGIPVNAAAVTGNITVVPSGPGFLTLFPSSAAQPTVANSNFQTNEITNNVFTVGLGAGDGAFKIFASATTHVIVDVTGYYAPPNTGGLFFHALATPVRLLETRPGFTGCLAPGAPLTGTGDPNANPNLDLLLQGRSPVAAPCNSIPATAQVLVGNATSVLPNAGGYLTIYPSGGTRPTVASSNYAGNDVINGPFAVKLGTDGKFKIYTFATTHLVVDILGYYSEDAVDANGAGLLFNPLPSPVRLLETRAGFNGCTMTGAPIAGNLNAATHTQMAANFCTLPASAQAVVGNVSVVNTTGAGFLTLFPANLTTAPLVATSNYPAPATFGYNRHFFVGLSPADGKFKVLTQFTTDLILDASGYFAP